MKTLAAIVALVSSAPALAQIGPVDVGAGFSWPVVGILAVVGAVIVGLIYWHRKNPTQEAAALAKAHEDMAAVALKAHDALAKLIGKLETAKTAPEATPAVTDGGTVPASPYNVPAAPPGPSAEQLAAVAAARKAYADALAAAGIVPPPAG